MKRFVVDRHGRIVFPFNFFPALDVSVFERLDQLEAVIRRDFADKARTQAEIVARVDTGGYIGRYELLRDLATNLFWANRYVMTMYDTRPTRWRDVPRRRGDVFLPVVTPIDPGPVSAVIETGYRALSPTWDAATERTIFGLLIEILRNRGGVELDAHAIVPTVAEARADSRARIYEISTYDPDYPVYRYNDVVGYRHRVPELEALMRHATVLRSEFPWNLEDTRCTAIGDLRGDEVVLLLHPRTDEVRRFLDRMKAPPARVRARRRCRQSRPGSPGDSACSRPMRRSTSSRPVRVCPMPSPRPFACSRKPGGRCSWSPARSSRTRSGPSEPPACSSATPPRPS